MRGLSLALLLCLLALPACQTAPVSIPPVNLTQDRQILMGRPGPGLVADPKSPIPDAPKPIGFKPIASQCSSSFNGITRTVHHVYQGIASTNETVQFVRQHVPNDGWKFLDFRSETGNAAVLVYTKGREALTVTVKATPTVATLTYDIGAAGTAPIAQSPAR